MTSPFSEISPLQVRQKVIELARKLTCARNETFARAGAVSVEHRYVWNELVIRHDDIGLVIEVDDMTYGQRADNKMMRKVLDELQRAMILDEMSSI